MSFSLFICADASPVIGTGHVMRCMALAQAAKAMGIPVSICGRVSVPWVQERLGRENVRFIPVFGDEIPEKESLGSMLSRLAHADDGAWVVLDGYHFGPESHCVVREAGYRLVVIDDYAHLPEYHSDILVNQNIGAEDLVYKGDAGSKLLGPKYALLRPEFMEARHSINSQCFPEHARNILLTLGGGDVISHLRDIASYLAQPEMKECCLRVISGAMAESDVRYVLRDCPADISVLGQIDNMSEQFYWADLCITAGGSTCWELCCLGVPFVTVKVAENQHNIVDRLGRLGIKELASRELLVSLIGSGEQRRRLAETVKGLTNGAGTRKVLGAIAAKNFFLRPVEPDDCVRIYDLINDPDINRLSAHPHTISLDEHKGWFERRVLLNNAPFFLAFIGKIFLGYVRFEPLEEDSESHKISIVVAKQWRGCGIGPALIAEASRNFFSSGGRKIVAFIRQENEFSIAAFCSAGFTRHEGAASGIYQVSLTRTGIS